MTTAIPPHLRTTTVCALLHDGFSPLVVDALQDAGASSDELRQVLLACVVAWPESDAARLAWADAVEEAEPERAEFLRVQVELARTPKCIYEFPGGFAVNCRCKACELGRRERELKTPRNMAKWFPSAPILGAEPTRGFIASLTCSWQDFLRLHESLIWSPTQTVECRCRGEYGEWNSAHCRYRCESYPCNPKTGRVPRPFVSTAQPIREVTLATWPDRRVERHRDRQQIGMHFSEGLVSFESWEGYRFACVKCGTCDGSGFDPASTRLRNPTPLVQRCPDCHGTPPNRWTCPAWPGLVVEMPEAEPFGIAVEDQQSDGTVRVLVGSRPPTIASPH